MYGQHVSNKYGMNDGYNQGGFVKKTFLPVGICHFYIRHGYCNNRDMCKWEHPSNSK